MWEGGEIRRRFTRDDRVEDVAAGRERFHVGRARGARERFARVRACGHGRLKIACRLDGRTHAVIPMGCGVPRVCKACATKVALRNQKKVGKARVRILREAYESMRMMPNRAGGPFGEKLVTLTNRHFALEDIEEGSRLWEKIQGFGKLNVTQARTEAIQLARPEFFRFLRDWFGRVCARGMVSRDYAKKERYRGPKGDRKKIAYYCLTEWTAGDDAKGHPHFHIYTFMPYVPQVVLERFWAAALRRIGCPVDKRADGSDNVNVFVQSLRSVNHRALSELAKVPGGEAKASRELGTFRNAATGAKIVLQYADGTMVDSLDFLIDTGRDDIAGDMFWAYEGKRLAQGSRGLLDPKKASVCLLCNQSHDAWGRSVFIASVVDPTSPPRYDSERGPP